ncbi:MAG: hypothetical protein JW806_02360 [Sedimentisphaerales bacterium]|nr:hypothetical protein [Sedimentisphaerales bacterium]
MPGIMDKLCWGRAIGVYYSEDRVSITDVNSTLKGSTILNQQEFKLAEEEPVQALTNILQEYIKENEVKKVPVCFGSKPERTFFTTSIMEYGEEEQLRDKLLERVGFRKPEERNGIVAEYFGIDKTKTPTSQLWSIGICKKKFASELYSAIRQAGFRDILFKATPWALSSYAMTLPKESKDWKVFIQVFLGETEGLAVLVVEKEPVCWKKFSITPTTAIANIEHAIKNLSMQSAVTLSRPRVDGIILQGSDAGKLSAKLYEEMNIETLVADGPGYTDSQCSHSLAMSAKSKNSEQFNLFRELKPDPTILEMFPWQLAVMVLLMVGCMGVMMWQKASRLARSYAVLEQQDALHTWASKKQTSDLSKERTSLLAETRSVEKFLATRIVWSDYLRELPTRLPPNVSLSTLSGECGYKGGDEKGGKTKKSLTLAGTVLVEEGGGSPEDIGTFVSALKELELLKKDFPEVELAEIKWRRKGESEVASFTVMALPKKAKKK